MGDLGLRPNGLLQTEVAARVLDGERWAAVEERTAELIACIQPNQPSEERRNAVANYVQRLIAKCFSCQVFTFGSVPLKTYLPDGDIDLTAFSNNENLKETWANEVRDVLENEERSENAEFRVKEVQYIQAEVKIIKCLVENIVVDISFNQVGGLCTLCFLEEIDHLINQNHLFKRSIILIKAWCYYESRILGAHHGLISTYALETLVLYIFHVFNNSFTGPLEVLYRFLEFFSNFDWDNFCVSLWGPVPISSLPDMTAEPPRKDSDGLLLSKHFLDACSMVYAVFPGGQDNQGQTFVSKYFNVIDPLRTNNNLGRSVSKGNFFRIRSAFAFGAKRLTRLLECPKENLIAEVNQFFMNTWERHGSGNRPDAPNSNLWNLRPSEVAPLEEPTTSRNTASNKKKTENIGLQGNEHHTVSALSFQSSATQVIKTINQHLQNAQRTSNPPAVTRMQNQKGYGNHINSGGSDQLERSISSSASGQAEKSQKTRPDYSVNDQEGQGRFQFARTRSSPELTDTSAEILSRVRRNRVQETVKTQNSHARLDYGRRVNNLGSEVFGGHTAKSSIDDPSALRHSPSNQSLEVTADANNMSNGFHDDTGFLNMGDVLSSVSEALERQQQMQQEEQDLVNMMASSRVHSFNGQLQLPMHFASPHLPLPLSPVLASMGYSQRNLAGMVPSNFTFIDPSWGSRMQFPQGFVSSPMSPYFPTAASLSSNPEDVVESANETSGITEQNPEDSDHGIWQDRDSESSRGFDSDNGVVQLLHSEDKKQPATGGFNSYSSSSRGSNSGAFVRGQQKFPEHKGTVRDSQADASLHQTTRGNDLNSTDRYPSLRPFPVSQASSSRTKSSSESSRDESSGKFSKSARDKWGRKSSSTLVGSMSSKAKNGWQFEGSSSHLSPQEEDDIRDWVPLSTMSADVVDRIPGSVSRSHQVAVCEAGQQVSGQDSVIPIAPMIVGNSRQRVVDNSGVVPIFYPTGPPVPFLTMLPFYNISSDNGTPDASSSHFHKDGVDDNQINASDQNFGLADRFDQAETQLSLAAHESTAPEPSDVSKPDILNSDFASHWQNLQFGRLCQNNQSPAPLVYPSPAMVPPVYVQGHVPWEGPGRPVSTNLNFVTQFMNYGPRLVPVASLQPGPNRPSGVFQRYGDEAPRFRGGTGTYLPNPKVPFRERQFQNSRNHRGYNYDRTDHADREGSWISAKARAAGHNHGRSQTEKPSTRLDRLGPSDKRADRPWDSYKHETVASHPAQNSSFAASNTAHGSANMPYGVYPVPSVSSNGVGPSGPVVMLYPFDQGVGHGSSSESSLEFGSLGPVHLSSVNEVPRSTDNKFGRRIHEQRHTMYRGSSPRSSPDHPSSPHIQR
ncbi:uncharacterized protein M6B38_365105 [Iris pallida]|uniref:Polymerase nucleotidyl transferase domain-containing protein n=1 Tax=Iris pallida TaxID=29817 RepID=A0AAX6GGB0_IRIPA|nr:uncharacterized protein M6B38_365105 [Iris pallida]